MCNVLNCTLYLVHKNVKKVEKALDNGVHFLLAYKHGKTNYYF